MPGAQANLNNTQSTPPANTHGTQFSGGRKKEFRSDTKSVLFLWRVGGGWVGGSQNGYSNVVLFSSMLICREVNKYILHAPFLEEPRLRMTLGTMLIFSSSCGVKETCSGVGSTSAASLAAFACQAALRGENLGILFV